MVRPLNHLGAQAMHVAEPAVWAVAPRRVLAGYRHFAAFLERPGSLE
jgi:hypothetical protein